MTKTKLFILFFLFLVVGSTFAQKSQPEWRKRLAGYKIKPVVAVQLWSTYTFDERLFNTETDTYEPVDNRFNTQVRRTRLGFKARPAQNFSFQLIAALDVVGRDVFSGVNGGANNGSVPRFGLWNASFRWRLKKNSEAFNLSGGYMPPQFGRESITSAFRVSSMEKAWSQRYLRGHLAGTNPGRAMGLNIGGLIFHKTSKVAFSYDLGIFNPVYQTYGGNSTGKKNAPLFVGRSAIHFGDPEFEKYTMGHQTNYFGQRKGLTLAIQGAAQEETDLFKANYAAGADALFNWGNFNFDGEWIWLFRRGEIEPEGLPLKAFTAKAQTGHMRLSYNIEIKGQYMLEPTIMLMQFKGEMAAAQQVEAQAVKLPSGMERAFDAGINFYLDPNFKISLHYTHHAGDTGDAGPGSTVNDYFYQKEMGPIQRGDWLGAGLMLVL